MRLKYFCPTFCLFILIGFCAACTPVVANRGNILDPDKLATIKVNTSTREEVAASLGTPTAVSTFDEKVWYYVGRQTEQSSFFDPEVVKQEAVEVHFDDQGTVVFLEKLNLVEAHDVDPVDRKTPTYGNDDTFIRQLLGNLGHATPKLGSQNH